MRNRLVHRLVTLVGAAAVATVTVLTSSTVPAGACSCAIGTESEMFGTADAVFTARLLDRSDPGLSFGRSSADFSTLRFEVDGVYKGDVAVDQVIVTEWSGASCGLEIAGDGPFLVFASRSHWEQDVPEGALYAGLCNGTRPLASQPVPASFGTAKAPTPPPAGTQPATVAPSPSGEDDVLPYFIGGVIALVAVVAGGIVLVSRRRGGRATA